MFRRYEHMIAQAVNAWPADSKFVPLPMTALTTFTARFRDAIASYKQFDWPSVLIDRVKFDKIYGSFVVKHDPENGCTWFCQRRAAGRAPGGMEVPNAFVPKANEVKGIQADLSPDEVRAFALLLANKRINGPVVIQGAMDSVYVTQLLQEFDIGIHVDSEANTTIFL